MWAALCRSSGSPTSSWRAGCCAASSAERSGALAPPLLGWLAGWSGYDAALILHGAAARGRGRLHLACPHERHRPRRSRNRTARCCRHRRVIGALAHTGQRFTVRSIPHPATRFAHPRTVVRDSLRPQPTRRESVMHGGLPLSPPAPRNAPHMHGRGRRLDDEQSNEQSNRRGFAGFAAWCARAFIRLDWRRCRIRRTINQRESRGPLRRPSLVIVLPMR